MYKLFAHEDIRNSGSGNAGLTNFMRQFGPGKGIWVLLIDIGKGVAASLLGKLLLAPLGIIGGLIFKKYKHFRNAKACFKGAWIGLGSLVAVIALFGIALGIAHL